MSDCCEKVLDRIMQGDFCAVLLKAFSYCNLFSPSWNTVKVVYELMNYETVKKIYFCLKNGLLRPEMRWTNTVILQIGGRF